MSPADSNASMPMPMQAQQTYGQQPGGSQAPDAMAERASRLSAEDVAALHQIPPPAVEALKKLIPELASMLDALGGTPQQMPQDGAEPPPMQRPMPGPPAPPARPVTQLSRV